MVVHDPFADEQCESHDEHVTPEIEKVPALHASHPPLTRLGSYPTLHVLHPPVVVHDPDVNEQWLSHDKHDNPSSEKDPEAHASQPPVVLFV